MLRVTGHFPTQNASKYLQQLCKHFAHKVTVEFDETHGTCTMMSGPAELWADAQGLTATVTAPDAESLPRAKGVIDHHLVTFAHREGFSTMTWAEPEVIAG